MIPLVGIQEVIHTHLTVWAHFSCLNELLLSEVKT